MDQLIHATERRVARMNRIRPEYRLMAYSPMVLQHWEHPTMYEAFEEETRHLRLAEQSCLVIAIVSFLALLVLLLLVMR